MIFLINVLISCYFLIAGSSFAFGNNKNIPIRFDDAEISVIRTLIWNEPKILGYPISQASNDTKVMARFGRSLFFDPRLSGGNSTACATCHMPARGWADGEAVPSRFPNVKRHTQSLWNMGYNKFFFWDGRADSLWSQALMPLENEAEMNSHRLKVTTLLVQDKYLRDEYEASFGKLSQTAIDLAGEGFSGNLVTENSYRGWERLYQQLPTLVKEDISGIFINVGKALAAYQNFIIAGDSAFDQFARELISDQIRTKDFSTAAQRGLKIFIGKGKCHTCHSGPNLTDGKFHRVNAPNNFRENDEGRYAGFQLMQRSEFSLRNINTKDEVEILSENMYGSFKTPTLRNVAISPPYTHAGGFSTLFEVVQFFYDKYTKENDLLLRKQEINDLEEFLKQLTDEKLTYDDPGNLRRINLIIDKLN